MKKRIENGLIKGCLTRNGELLCIVVQSTVWNNAPKISPKRQYYCTKKMKFKAKCDSYIPARMGPMSGETNMLATEVKQIVFLPKPPNLGKN